MSGRDGGGVKLRAFIKFHEIHKTVHFIGQKDIASS
jgi:hypothetical protein